jgi:hypothetical protein
MLIDGWECTELHAGTEWAMREAKARNVTVTADASGLDIEERSIPYMGASGRVGIPADVLMWLIGAVR